MKDYFKPTYMRWFYRPHTFFGNIKETFRWFKWLYQRATRGWADCDWWGMDYYLVEIILPMLKHFKENTISYPGDDKCSTPEKWDGMLDEMIEGFEAAKRVCEDDYSVPIKDWLKMSKKDQRLFKKKAKLFIERFFDLWD